MEGVITYFMAKNGTSGVRGRAHQGCEVQNEWRESSTRAINEAQKRKYLIAVRSRHLAERSRF